MHERDIVHDGPTHTNHHKSAAPPNTVASCAHTALHASTFDDGSRHRVLVLAVELPDLGGGLLGTELRLDLVRLAVGDELLREVQPLSVDVSDDQGVGTRSPRSGEGDEPDGTRAADERRPAQFDISASHAVEDHAQGLEKSTFAIRELIGDPTNESVLVS